MRIVLGGLMAFDALVCARFLYPSKLAWLAIPAVIAALLFARRPAASLWGWISLGSVAVLVQAQAALAGGPMRFLFFSGTCLLGWLFGLAFARWQKLEPEPLAEAGAVGALSAAYVGALLGKLATPDWTGGLRTIIAGQHAWGHSRLLDGAAMYVLEHPWVATLLGVFTLVAQASALLMPFSRRGRMVSATLLLLFHAGVWLLTPIFFPQAMVLLATFGFRPEPKPLPPASRAAMARAGLAVAGVVILAWLPWVRALTHAPHLDAGQPATAATRALLGDVVEGASVGGFRVEHIDEPAPQVIRLVLQRGAQSMVVELVRHGQRHERPPRTAGDLDLFFQKGEVPEATQQAVLEALVPRLRH